MDEGAFLYGVAQYFHALWTVVRSFLVLALLLSPLVLIGWGHRWAMRRIDAHYERKRRGESCRSH